MLKRFQTHRRFFCFFFVVVFCFVCLFVCFLQQTAENYKSEVTCLATAKKDTVRSWCRHSRDGPIMNWFAVLEVLHYILSQPSLLPLPVLTHPQTPLPVLRHPQESLYIYLSSLAVFTSAYTSSHILTRTYTPLGVLSDIPLTSESVAKLYNFLAMSERCKDNGVNIRRKNVHPVQGKLLQVHMKKRAFINLFCPRQTPLPVLRHPQESLYMYLSSLAVLTRAYTSSHILNRTYTPLGVLSDIPLTSESVAKLYNFLAMSERCKDNGVNIRRKNVHQVQGKLLQVHMKKRAFINLFCPHL